MKYPTEWGHCIQDWYCCLLGSCVEIWFKLFELTSRLTSLSWLGISPCPVCYPGAVCMELCGCTHETVRAKVAPADGNRPVCCCLFSPARRALTKELGLSTKRRSLLQPKQKLAGMISFSHWIYFGVECVLTAVAQTCATQLVLQWGFWLFTVTRCCCTDLPLFHVKLMNHNITIEVYRAQVLLCLITGTQEGLVP